MNRPPTLFDPTVAAFAGARAPQGAAPAEADPRPPAEMRDVVDALRRQSLLIGAAFALVTAAAFGLYKLQPPTYTTSARVLVQTDQLGTPSLLSGIAAYRESQFAEPVTRKLETEMALLASRRAASSVVERYAIGPEALPAAPWAPLLRHWNALVARWLGAPPPPALGIDGLVDAFLSQIAIEPVRSKTAETTSNVLEIRFESTDRQLAPLALDALLDAYVADGAREGDRLARATTGLMKKQVAEAQSELQAVDAQLTALAVRESGRSGLLPGAAGSTAGPRGESDSAVAQLVAQTVQLQGQLEEQRGTYTDQAPVVRSTRQRLEEARARLAAQLRANANASAEFSRLDRQRSLLQDHYVELRRKLDQIDLYTELNPTASNGRLIVDRPNLPTLRSAHRSKTLALAGPVAGLLLGLLLAALREASTRRVRNRRDVERALGMPMLGALPVLRISA